MSTATYVYCLVQSPRQPSLKGAPAGLPGASKPRAIDAGKGLWLVAADAPLDRYREEASAGSAGAPGAAFLLRKKKEHEAQREVIDHARDRADALFELLAAKADDARRRPPPPGEIGKRVLLDAAFLLPREKSKGFQAAVRAEAKKLADRDYQLTLTGPWPAYTFVSDPEAR